MGKPDALDQSEERPRLEFAGHISMANITGIALISKYGTRYKTVYNFFLLMPRVV